MLRFSQLRTRIEMLFKNRNVEARVDGKLKDHVARQIEENTANGMSAGEARNAALRKSAQLVCG